MPQSWTSDGDKPARAGWYAVLWCYDPEEGTFPDAKYWNGDRWTGDRIEPPVTAWSCQRFEDKDRAMQWAEANDPGT